MNFEPPGPEIVFRFTLEQAIDVFEALVCGDSMSDAWRNDPRSLGSMIDIMRAAVLFARAEGHPRQMATFAAILALLEGFAAAGAPLDLTDLTVDWGGPVQ